MFFETANSTPKAASEIQIGDRLIDNIDPTIYRVTSVTPVNEWTTKLEFEVAVDEPGCQLPHNAITSLTVANTYEFPIQN